MRNLLTYCFCFVFSCCVSAQKKFHFNKERRSVKLSFKMVNNLIILPIKVNGVELNFLLDTGVEETILFSLDEKKEVFLHDVKNVKLIGLGTNEPVEGLKAYKNTFAFSDLQLIDQEIIVILDENFNLSASLGTEVNGIIGSHFFNKSIVKIDYARKKIVVYNPESFNQNKVLKKFQSFDIELHDAKPYLTTKVELNGNLFPAKCLIDCGNSDGLWLFQNKTNVVIPKRNFDDYLGRGFSGDIHGKKAKVNALSLNQHRFENVITSFPDDDAFANINMVDNRLGSIGGEILKRFTVVFDYQNNKMYLKKNKYFNDKFKYNISGIVVNHVGMQWYKEEIPLQAIGVEKGNPYNQTEFTELKYKFKLLPIYEILNIRKNSSAEKVGLCAGDVILKINGYTVHKMNLENVNQLLRTDNKEEMTILVARDGKELSFSFKIVDLL